MSSGCRARLGTRIGVERTAGDTWNTKARLPSIVRTTEAHVNVDDATACSTVMPSTAIRTLVGRRAALLARQISRGTKMGASKVAQSSTAVDANTSVKEKDLPTGSFRQPIDSSIPIAQSAMKNRRNERGTPASLMSATMSRRSGSY